MKTAEDIIKSKKYIELTSKERELVAELVANEDEFEAMKWFLLETENSFASEKIEASANLRSNVMAHLNKQQAAPKVFWLNGVGAFLFPENKKIYQYPALQIAAVAVLLISVISVYNYNKDFKQELAINQPISNDAELNEANKTRNTEPEIDNLEKFGTTTNAPSEQGDELTLEKDLKSTLIDRKDETPAQTAYYKQLSAAEENKISVDDVMMPAEELFEDASSLDNNENERLNQAVPTNTQEKVVLTESISLSDVSKNDNYRKENTKKENKRDSDKSFAFNDAPAGVATTVSDTTTLKSKDTEEKEGGYLTGTAGGVYGETSSETTTGTSKPDQDETTKEKVSVADSKLIKKLLFIVK